MVGRLLVVAMVSALGCSEDNRCEVDLEKYATTCPQTFDGTPAALPVCMDESLIYAARACGDLIGLVISYRGINGATCYYDASSHELVGAKSWTDVPTYCGDDGTSQYAGRTSSTCTSASEQLATKDCSSQP